jgi:lipoyl-dependent peroxiredoxin
MTEKTASVHWEGPGKKGQGQISTETGALERDPYGFASRFEDIASAAQRECPLSTALAAVAEISLHATLEAAAR